MQTIYLRETNTDFAADVEHFLKKKKHPELKGRLGLSFVIGLGLDRLEEEFRTDPASILDRAVRVSQARRPAPSSKPDK